MKILLATDSSEHSEAAIAAVAGQHIPDGSEIHIVSVVAPAFPIAYGTGVVDTSLYQTLERNGHDTARSAVENAAVKIRAGAERRNVTITTRVMAGSPRHAILEEAEALHVDLIVVGSHGYGAIDRFLLGSVSQAIAVHAKCSVLIVRRPERPSDETARQS